MCAYSVSWTSIGYGGTYGILRWLVGVALRLTEPAPLPLFFTAEENWKSKTDGKSRKVPASPRFSKYSATTSLRPTVLFATAPYIPKNRSRSTTVCHLRL